MPSAREALCGAAIGGKFYAVGGYDRASNTLTGRLEVYDPATDTWQARAPMPTPRREAAIGVINGQMHVVGGSTTDPSGGTSPQSAGSQMGDNQIALRASATCYEHHQSLL